jgi:uncharacterized membrane protein (DUF485 family)
MSPLSLSDISKHPAFIELVRKRFKLRVTMIGLMMLVFITYLISWAYFPQLVNLRLPADSSISIGIWFTVVVVIVAIVLSAYYSIFAGKELDELNKKLLKEVGHDA